MPLIDLILAAMLFHPADLHLAEDTATAGVARHLTAEKYADGILVLVGHKGNGKDRSKGNGKNKDEPDPIVVEEEQTVTEDEVDLIVTDNSCDVRTTYDPAEFDNVLEDFEQTETLSLSGPAWNNTLVRNCRIHDTGSDGIFIKDVRNVVVTGCEIWNTDGEGIKTSSSGSTADVTLDGNHIHDTASQGIHSPQRSADGIDHKNLKILNNVIENVDSHAIYVQSQDFLIEGNTVRGRRKSNGISVRSSGVVRCNRVEGFSTEGKPGIRYYSDHQTGLSNTLIIERNLVVNDGVGIDLYPLRDRYDGKPPPDHVVKKFVIRYNDLEAHIPIQSAEDYEDPAFTLQIYDNTIVQN